MICIAIMNDGIHDRFITVHYRSGDYQDELGWSAVWLYQATGDEQYLHDAEINRVTGAGWGDSWDDKTTYTNVKA